MSRRGFALLALAAAAGLTLVQAIPAAAENDDSAKKLFTIKDQRIAESSGLATAQSLPGVVWTINDSGGAAEIYGLDDRGRTVAVLTLSGATARDWEAVGVGPRDGGGHWLWVGDIGDNLSSWPTVRLYRVAEPTELGEREEPWTAFDLRFPDGPRDAEALLVDPADGRLYVVSKRVQGAAVYRAPKDLREDAVNELHRVGAAPPLVTDGSMASDGRVALRDYLQAHLSEGVDGPRTRLSLPLVRQGESLTWTSDEGAVLVGSEGVSSPVYQVPVVAPTAPTPEPAPTESGPATDSASDPGGSGPSPWLVAVLGLLVGGAAAGVVRLRR